MAKRKQQKSGFSASSVARGGVMIALSVVILAIAYLLEVADLTVACLASMLVYIMLLEYQPLFAVCIYLGTALLSFILMPTNSGVICYTLVFGWFPIAKHLIDCKIKNRFLAFLPKAGLTIVGFAVMLLLFFKMFVGEMDFASLLEEFPIFIGEEVPEFALWINEKVLFGINRLQWIMVGIYLIFAPILTFLCDLLYDKLRPFYAYRIRPLLLKAKLL